MRPAGEGTSLVPHRNTAMEVLSTRHSLLTALRIVPRFRCFVNILIDSSLMAQHTMVHTGDAITA
jgi:hypothetical protein